MTLRKSGFGFVTGAVIAAAGMAVFASSAFAGWVVDIEVEGMPAMGKMSAGKEASKEQGPTKVVMKLQDKKSRLDVDKMSIISSVNDPNTTVLMHEMKMKMTTPTPKPPKTAEGEAKEGDKPRATGKKDKISGYDVEEYVVEKPKQKITLWLTQDGNAGKAREEMEQAFARQARDKDQFDLKGLPGCPIRVIVDVPAVSETRPNGKTVEKPASKVTMTVMSIKEESLAEAVFQAPGDYQDLSKMGGGPGGGMPGGGMPGGPAPKGAPAQRP